MTVDYNDFAQTFSNSRINMKWDEVDYFLDLLSKNNDDGLNILDVGCGNGRLLDQIENKGLKIGNYLGVDLSLGLIDEARVLHQNNRFKILDMQYIGEIIEMFDCIFFIASFHHLQTIEQRKIVLEQAKKLIKKDGTIFMTNWALDSELNSEKYKNSNISNSKNEYGSQDYNVKIGDYTRFYHSFTIEELDFLFKNTGFEIIENRLFDNGRNYLSIIK